MDNTQEIIDEMVRARVTLRELEWAFLAAKAQWDQIMSAIQEQTSYTAEQLDDILEERTGSRD